MCNTVFLVMKDLINFAFGEHRDLLGLWHGKTQGSLTHRHDYCQNYKGSNVLLASVKAQMFSVLLGV